ncbi:F-box protein At5g49610-like [Silene latifolia]|uniref:F-box protein At5g49610-like n=1 Tax=Silene latifolia TaxID=37657 RepID=UPI003D777E1D
MDHQEEGEENVSASLIPHMADEITLNILHRLPVRSQIRFQIVSRTWQDLISNPTRPDSCYSVSNIFKTPILTGFLVDDLPYAIHYLPITIDPQVNAHVKSANFKSFEFLPRNFDDEYRILASSNGSLLFSRTTVSDPQETTYVVCNPFTGQAIVLPFTDCHTQPRVCFDTELDHSRTKFHFSVVLLYIGGMDGVKIKMFTSKGINRVTYHEFPSLYHKRLISSCRKPVGAINGIFYWLSYPLIVTIDLNKSTVETAYLPSWNNNDEHCLCISEGRIYYVNKFNNILQLWVSQAFPGKDSFCWESLYTTDTSEHGFSVFKFIGFHPRDPMTVVFTVNGSTGSKICKLFNFQQNSIQLPHTSPTEFSLNASLEFFPCEWFPWPLPLHS